MKRIYTECIVSLSHATDTGAGTTLDSHAAIIRVVDDAAGPYLMIGGRSIDEDDNLARSFPLNSVAEIDQFAAICRARLAQAEV